MRELAGRVAVVTGAAGGIGRALSLELARAGMDVALADVDEEGLRRVAGEVAAAGRRTIAVPTDVTDSRALDVLLARTVEELGACHLMANNAGVYHANTMLGASEAQWRRVIDINLWGVIHGCRVFGKHFEAQGEGHLLNTASAAGLFPMPGMSSYSTSKAAVIAFSRQLRWELAAAGVGVTVMCPGVVRTSMSKKPGVGLEHIDMDEVVRKSPSPEGLARKAVLAVRQNRALIRYGPDAFMLSWLRHLPDFLFDALGRFMASKAREVVRPPSAPSARDPAP